MPEPVYEELMRTFHIPTGIYAKKLDYKLGGKKIEVILVGIPTAAGPLMNCPSRIPPGCNILQGLPKCRTKAENTRHFPDGRSVADDFIYIEITKELLGTASSGVTEAMFPYGEHHWKISEKSEVYCDTCMSTASLDHNPIVECGKFHCYAGRHVGCWFTEPRPTAAQIPAMTHLCDQHQQLSHARDLPRAAHYTPESPLGPTYNNFPPRKNGSFSVTAGSHLQVICDQACDGLMYNSQSLGLETRRSTLPKGGSGLFTQQGRGAGSTLCYFFGLIISKERMDTLTETGQCSCSAEQEFLEDHRQGICRSLDLTEHISDSEHEFIMLVSRQCPAGYINDPRSSPASKKLNKENCRIIWPRVSCADDSAFSFLSFAVEATSSVEAGSELFFSYKSYDPSGRRRNKAVPIEIDTPRPVIDTAEFLHFMTPPETLLGGSQSPPPSGTSPAGPHLAEESNHPAGSAPRNLMAKLNDSARGMCFKKGPPVNDEFIPACDENYENLQQSQADADETSQMHEELQLDDEEDDAEYQQSINQQIIDNESDEDQDSEDQMDIEDEQSHSSSGAEHQASTMPGSKRIGGAPDQLQHSQPLPSHLQCRIRDDRETRKLPHWKPVVLSQFEIKMITEEATTFVARVNQKNHREGKKPTSLEAILVGGRGICNLKRLPNEFAEVLACCADPEKRKSLPETHPFASLNNFVVARFASHDGTARSSVMSMLAHRVEDVDDLKGDVGRRLHRVISFFGVRICESCFRAFSGLHRNTIFKRLKYLKTGTLAITPDTSSRPVASPVTDELVNLLFKLCNDEWADGGVPNPTNKTVDSEGNPQYTMLDAPFTQIVALCDDLGLRLYGPRIPGIPRKDVCPTTVKRALTVLKKDHKIFLSFAKIKRFMKCTTCQTLDNEKRHSKSEADRAAIAQKRQGHYRQVAEQRGAYSAVRDQAKSVTGTSDSLQWTVCSLHSTLTFILFFSCSLFLLAERSAEKTM